MVTYICNTRQRHSVLGEREIIAGSRVVVVTHGAFTKPKHNVQVFSKLLWRQKISEGEEIKTNRFEKTMSKQNYVIQLFGNSAFKVIFTTALAGTFSPQKQIFLPWITTFRLNMTQGPNQIPSAVVLSQSSHFKAVLRFFSTGTYTRIGTQFVSSLKMLWQVCKKNLCFLPLLFTEG